jgi:hypothetical protein
MKFVYVAARHKDEWSLGVDLSKTKGYVWVLCIGLGRRSLIVEIGNQCGYDYDWMEDFDDAGQS